MCTWQKIRPSPDAAAGSGHRAVRPGQVVRRVSLQPNRWVRCDLLATVAGAMALGSLSSGALYEVSVEDVDRMLSLDETLFVAHKAGIGEKESFKILQAIAAFANTAGGGYSSGYMAERSSRAPSLCGRRQTLRP